MEADHSLLIWKRNTSHPLFALWNVQHTLIPIMFSHVVYVTSLFRFVCRRMIMNDLMISIAMELALAIYIYIYIYIYIK